MNRYINIVFIAIVLLFISINNNYAQKVGVVLSGGGAKGLYHIGILKALEENNIPIDNITGTSMGAIIGGMYASGMSIKDMEEIFCSNQVSTWLTGKIEMKYQNYYRTIDKDGSIISLDIDAKKIFTGNPTGKRDEEMLNRDEDIKAINFDLNNIENYYINTIIPSLQLDLALMNYFTAPIAAAKHNFDSLFVPFRCVSVDILKREEFLWSKGDLGKAIRASMAIPFVFKPIIVDSMMMYDGGILNNFPWKENLEEFDSDVLIGGICTSDSIDPSSLTGQLSLLAMNKTDYAIPNSIGVKIERDVDVGILDYSKAKVIIEIGYQDALLAIPKIKKLVKRSVTPNEVAIQRRRFKERMPAFAIDEIEVTGLNKKQTEYVQNQLHFTQGGVLSFEDFKREYFKIIEGEMIAGGFPTAIYNPETGYYKIYMSMTARHSFKAMAGINISSTNINAGYLGFNYSKIGRNSSSYTLSGYLGNFYSAAELSSRQNFYAGKRPFYVNSTINYGFQDYGRGNSQRTSFANRVFDYSRFNGAYVSTAIGVPLDQKSKLELRAVIGQDKYNYDSHNSTNPLATYNKNRLNYINLSASISRNSLNYRTYATKGIKQSISLLSTYSGDTYHPGFVNMEDQTHTPGTKNTDFWFGASFYREKYTDVTNHFTMGYSIEAIYTTIADMSSSYALKLVSPGFYPTEHSHTLFIPEYHSRSFAAIGIKPIFKWNETLYMKNEFYLHYSNLNKYDDVIKNLRYIISSSIVYQSPIGPVSFNYSHYAIKDSSMSENYFTFNIGYLIFKNRGIKYF